MARSSRKKLLERPYPVSDLEPDEVMLRLVEPVDAGELARGPFWFVANGRRWKLVRNDGAAFAVALEGEAPMVDELPPGRILPVEQKVLRALLRVPLENPVDETEPWTVDLFAIVADTEQFDGPGWVKVKAWTPGIEPDRIAIEIPAERARPLAWLGEQAVAGIVARFVGLSNRTPNAPLLMLHSEAQFGQSAWRWMCAGRWVGGVRKAPRQWQWELVEE